MTKKVYVAIPAMDEPDLPGLLLSLNEQQLVPEAVYVCINQPESYYDDGDARHIRITEVNADVYGKLQAMKAEGDFHFRLELIDGFSKENAWDKKHIGVGWARKTAMDAAMQDARRRYGDESDGILACMDADTFYPADYLASMESMFAAYPQAVGMANPYYHPSFCGTESGRVRAEFSQSIPDQNPDQRVLHEKVMLHYEVYMRSYLLQMMIQRHPYAFTAVGSSMACTWKAYRKIGGISPFKSGEDFYFLQKLLKTGPLIVYSPSCSMPSSRLSSRVFFGTGPALTKGLRQDWKSYPIYPMNLFSQMKQAYQDLVLLFDGEESESVKNCFTSAFGENWYQTILANSGGRRSQFLRFCTEKFDALRSLQYLKSSYAQDDFNDWRNLKDLCLWLLENCLDSGIISDLGKQVGDLMSDTSVCALSDLSLQNWSLLRNFLFLCEHKMQKLQPLLPCW